MVTFMGISGGRVKTEDFVEQPLALPGSAKKLQKDYSVKTKLLALG